METFVDDKKTLLQLYNTATSEPHSFLYVKLTAKKKDDMFYMNFDRRLAIEEGED